MTIDISLSKMLSLFCLIIHIYYNNCSSNAKLIALPFNVYYGAFYSEYTIGNPFQRLNHAIDQEREFSWTSNDFFKREKSQTIKVLKESKLRFRHLTLFGAILEDTIIPEEDHPINDFPFYVINNIRAFNSRVGGYGFASKFRDERYSIIHRYKQQGLIDHLAYSFVPHPNNINGTMFLGGIPQESINNKYSASCPLNHKYSNWACDLSYVFIGDISYIYDNVYYNNHDFAFFQVAERRILVPQAFMTYLNETYFQEYILNKKCRNQYVTMNREFVCDCDIRNKLPQLNFIFNDKVYTLKASELFMESGPECFFLITSNHLREGNWVFGALFLKNYISSFDYEKSLISFYSSSPIESIDLERIFPWRRVYRWSMIVLVILFILIIVRYVYKRMTMKRKRRKDPIVEQYEEMH